MNSKVYVVGLGMTKFVKPTEDSDYPELVQEAVDLCFKDSKLSYGSVDHAVCCYVYGDSTSGQRSLYDIGLTGIPILNVNNNCATGSSGLYMGANLIKSGASQCCLVLGFEKMQKGSLSSVFNDRANPMQKHVEVMINEFGFESSPIMAQMFGNAGREHMAKYGTKPEHFAKIAWKNHKHSVNNPKSQMQQEYSLNDILQSTMIHSPLTKLQCCPTSNGAAAVMLVSHQFLQSNRHLRNNAVEIKAMAMGSDTNKVFESKSAMELVGYDMTKRASNCIYRQCNLRPSDFKVIELHDCFSANELISYEAMGLCPEGGAGQFIDSGNNTYGGHHVINPSGGLISKGHPLGATGVAQCIELCLHIRGEAGRRQVPGDIRYALQHNLGLGGAIFMAAYSRPDFDKVLAKL